MYPNSKRKKLKKLFQLLADFPYHPAYDRAIDELLGLDEREVKRRVLLGQLAQAYRLEATWLERPTEDLFTPYQALCQLFAHLSSRGKKHWVDLGSGIGRVGLALGILHPELKFTGLELVKERNVLARQAARLLGLKQTKFLERDLSSPKTALPLADIYFLFNPFTQKTLLRVLTELHRNLTRRPHSLIVVVKNGRTHQLFRRVSWLKVQSELEIPGWEGKGFTVYGRKS